MFGILSYRDVEECWVETRIPVWRRVFLGVLLRVDLFSTFYEHRLVLLLLERKTT